MKKHILRPRERGMVLVLGLALALLACAVWAPVRGGTPTGPVRATPTRVPTQPSPRPRPTSSRQQRTTTPPLAPPDVFQSWQRTNPGGGGAFNTAAIGPTGAWLVGSDLSGAYLSWNQGETWLPLGAAQGLTETHVVSVAFDPVNPAVLYVGAEVGIFRSANRGETFVRVLDHGYITALAFAPSDPNIGYAAHHSRHDVADGRVYATYDRGLTWQPLPNEGLPAGVHILTLQVHPQDPQTVYALTGEGRFACGPAALFVSTDGGVTWTRWAEDLGQVLDFALDPHSPERFYLSTYGDVWDPGYTCITDDPDGGWVYLGVTLTADEPTWQVISQDLGPRNVLLWPDRARPGGLRVLDLDWREVWATTDQGATWNLVSTADDWDPGWTWGSDAFGTSFDGDAHTWIPHPQDPDLLLWVDSQFVWVTYDGGAFFEPTHTRAQPGGGWQSTGLDNIVPMDLALDADGQHVYLALSDLGCFRSPDGGASWFIANEPAATGTWAGRGGNSATVLADPARAGVVWLSLAPEWEDPAALLRSDDFAQTWAFSDNGLPAGPITGLSLDPNSPTNQRVLFVAAAGDVYRSTDDGWTWALVLDCDGCRVTAVDPQDPQQVWAGGEAGLWHSAAGGAAGTWAPVGPAAFAADPDMGNATYWDWDWQGVAAIRPASDGVWLAVHGPGRGVYHSPDGGATWTQVLAHDYAWDVLPLEGQNWVVAATSSARLSGGYEPIPQGVWVSPDRGQTWRPFNQGLAWPFAVTLAYDASQQRLWAGMPGLGYAWRTFP